MRSNLLSWIIFVVVCTISCRLTNAFSLIKLAQDLCRRNPSESYCQPINGNDDVNVVKTEIRRAPLDVTQLVSGISGAVGEKSPMAFGQVTGNNANFEVPGLGNLGIGTSISDIAKFTPDGAKGPINGGTFNIEDSKFGFSQQDTGSGRTKERHGFLKVAGLGTFDVGKKSENGGAISDFLGNLIPKIPEPPGGIENPRPPPNSNTEEEVQADAEAAARPYYYSNAYEGNSKKYQDMIKDFERKTRIALAAKTETVEDEEEESDSESTREGFLEQPGPEVEKLTPQVLTVNQLRGSAGNVPLSELGLETEQVSALCQRFSVIAAQHCYGSTIEPQYVDKCRGYAADCAAYISEAKPLGAVANSFSSNVGITYGNVGVNGIPYYAINEEGAVNVGHNGKVDFGSWGGGYSDAVAVKDFWTQTSESGGNWYEGVYGYKSGWRVPIAAALGVEGGGGTHVSVPLKEGSFGQPVQVSNGYHVGPYVGLAESLGVDWFNGGVSASRGFALPIVGVNGNAGTSIGFPSLGTAMRAMGLGNIGVGSGTGIGR